jgi:hypothetical protein
MRFKLILFFLLFISCNGTEEDLGECYVAPEPDGTCIEIYEPVCACNDLVYSTLAMLRRLVIGYGNLQTLRVVKNVIIKL